MAQKPLFQIPEKLVWTAFKEAEHAVGADAKIIRGFKLNRNKQLHQLWNQLSSGKYYPAPFRRAYKRKGNGKWRAIGIPTDRDDIVLMILKNQMVSKFYSLYYPNSFFHQQGNKRQKAVETVLRRCLRYNWVLYFDVKNYGDNINHLMLLSMVKKYIKSRWLLLYTHRMLKAPTRMKNGIGEDVRFMQDCRKKGYKAFATSPFNYVYVRRKNRNSHTWHVRDSLISRRSKLIAVTKNYRTIAAKRV